MSILRKNLLRWVVVYFISSIFLSCSKDGPVPETNSITHNFKTTIIQTDKGFISNTIVRENEVIEFPLAFNFEKFELKINFNSLSDEINCFFGKGLGGVKIDGDYITILNTNGIIQNEFEYEQKKIKELSIIRSFDNTKVYINDSIVSNTNLIDNYYNFFLRGKPQFYVINGSCEIEKYSITTNSMGKILIIGDSIVEGGIFPLLKLPLSLKWTSILQKYYGEQLIMVDGFGGSKMDQDNANRIIEQLKWTKPRFAFICFGTNNVHNAEEYIENIQKIISYANTNDIKIILSTALPRQNYDFNKSGVKINDWIKSSGVETLDYYNLLYNNGVIQNQLFAVDQFHPNKQGNEVIATAAINILSKNNFN